MIDEGRLRFPPFSDQIQQQPCNVTVDPSFFLNSLDLNRLTRHAENLLICKSLSHSSETTITLNPGDKEFKE